MGLLSSLSYFLGGWEEKARDALKQLVDQTMSMFNVRLPIYCYQILNVDHANGAKICFAAVAYGAVIYAVFRRERNRELVAKFESYRRIIRNMSEVSSEVVDEIDYAMRTRPASFSVLWDYVGSVGYNEDMVTTILISEWLVRKLCSGDVPGDISKACAVVQETILTASRHIVL